MLRSNWVLVGLIALALLPFLRRAMAESRDGIVWAVENGRPAVLHAYDANNLAYELYNSTQAPAWKDYFGEGNKFITPMIAHGKVYGGTVDGVGVFGLLRRSASSRTRAATP